jgi:hypothetical protein
LFHDKGIVDMLGRDLDPDLLPGGHLAGPRAVTAESQPEAGAESTAEIVRRSKEAALLGVGSIVAGVGVLILIIARDEAMSVVGEEVVVTVEMLAPHHNHLPGRTLACPAGAATVVSHTCLKHASASVPCQQVDTILAALLVPGQEQGRVPHKIGEREASHETVPRWPLLACFSSLHDQEGPVEL